jgi:hypothetical protein
MIPAQGHYEANYTHQVAAGLAQAQGTRAQKAYR